MKEKDEINLNPKANFYAVLYQDFRKAALDCGYALALHGSMARDLDLIAVAWVPEAKPVEDLVTAISERIGKTAFTNYHLDTGSEKPHGRICYTLSISGDWFIDLSIISPKAK